MKGIIHLSRFLESDLEVLNNTYFGLTFSPNPRGLLRLAGARSLNFFEVQVVGQYIAKYITTYLS